MNNKSFLKEVCDSPQRESFFMFPQPAIAATLVVSGRYFKQY
jgi:hypothetical protein